MTLRRSTFTLVATLLLAAAGSAAAQPCTGWQEVASPAPMDGSNLFGVDGLTPNDVWAVGYYDDKYNQFSADQFSLTLHWNGSTWTEVASPSPGLYIGGGTDVYLYDVEMVTASDVWAAGTHKTQHSVDGFVGFQYFTLHWDGSTWTQVPAPETPVGGTGAYMNGLDALGPGDVWAVGSRTYPEVPGIDEVATAVHWDGGAWTETVLPIVNEHQDLLRVRAFTADDVWAVGGHGTEPTDQVYVVRWDGTDWSLVPGVPEPGIQNLLLDVDGVSSSDLWVVGEINDGLGGTRPLLFHYDGAGWQEFGVVGFDGFQGRVEALTVVASDDVWASGTSTEADQTARLFILHWDGSAWREVASAPGGPTFGWFQSMASTGPCDVWTVGQAGGVTQTQRLVDDTLQPAELTAVSVAFGRLLGGDLLSLTASDDDRLEIAAADTGTLFAAGAEIDATSPVSPVGRMEVRVEWSRSGAPIDEVGGTVRLLDRVSGAWVALAPARIETSDAGIAWTSIADPGRFVDPETGTIRTQVVSRSRNAAPAYTLALDRVEITVGR